MKSNYSDYLCFEEMISISSQWKGKKLLHRKLKITIPQMTQANFLPNLAFKIDIPKKKRVNKHNDSENTKL
ncbi:hypothetical protein OUZ56_016222 [Daphnia magna]|uniref:Uncharacterized protein n=1 Tax=Daphnia magna TaxID=35525 RepID=A0ABR0AQ05_9CRUS|nr:hypothetical protein OUZ56_016222 [Daphnia magna]